MGALPAVADSDDGRRSIVASGLLESGVLVLPVIAGRYPLEEYQEGVADARVLVPSARTRLRQVERQEKPLWRQVVRHCRVRRRWDKALHVDVTEQVTL